MAPKLLDKKEVADLLRKTVPSLNWMIQSGTAPKGAKIGGRLYWREADVLAWIDAQFDEVAS